MIDWQEFAFFIFLVLIVVGISLMMYGVVSMLVYGQSVDCACVDPNIKPHICVGV